MPTLLCAPLWCTLDPVLDADLVAVVKADVIGDAIPAHDETHAMLRQRLSQSTAFDNPRLIFPKRTRHGYFKHQSDVRVREGGQSRRVTYGDPLQSMVVDESGRATVRMRWYTHLYRHREDARMCRPLCLQVKAALSEKSKSLGPPTSCDVLFYYAELKMTTGRHRDAFDAKKLKLTLI